MLMASHMLPSVKTESPETPSEGARENVPQAEEEKWFASGSGTLPRVAQVREKGHFRPLGADFYADGGSGLR